MLKGRAGRGVAAAMLVAVAVVLPARAAGPDGPRLAVLESGSGGKTSLVTVDAAGGDRRVLGGVLKGSDPLTRLPLSWSPDGSSLALATGAKRGRRISIVPASGGRPIAVPGTGGGFLPVFSPDGRSVAFARMRNRRVSGEPAYVRYESTAVWIVDLVTGETRQLTRWRDDLEHVPSSFSPDGSTLLVTRWDQERSGESEVVALRFDGRTSGLLVGEGSLPVYSPDGSKIALFRIVERRVKPRKVDSAFGGEGVSYGVEQNSELYVIDADGTRLRRLTRTPGKDEGFASWDPSSERLAYTQSSRRRLNAPNAVMQINADGTCATKVRVQRGVTFYGPVWRPGPAHKAGRIEC